MSEVTITTRAFEARWLSFQQLLVQHYAVLSRKNEPREAAAAALEMAALVLQPEITLHVDQL